MRYGRNKRNVERSKPFDISIVAHIMLFLSDMISAPADGFF